MPTRVNRVLSSKPVREDDLLAAMNWEILPALRSLLDAYNNSVGPVSSFTTEDTIVDASIQYYLVDPTAGDVTISLPSAAGWTMPLFVRAINNSNNVTVEPFGSDTIEGSNSPFSASIFSPFALSLISDGISGWWLI